MHIIMPFSIDQILLWLIKIFIKLILLIFVNSEPDLKHLRDEKYWKKEKILGRGTFGVVYSYTLIEKAFRFAIKQVTFDPSDPYANSDMKALENEINTLTKLEHERIVTFFGSYKDDEKFILSVCLKLMEGGSLYTLLHEKGALDLRATIEYTRQILEGVAYLHCQHIMHRDIKGKNILLEDLNHIKLADFGISKKLETLSSTHGAKTNAFGTVRWMAPEIFSANDKNEYGLKVDIWSVGCTVVEMLTTCPPWSAVNEATAMLQISKGEYPSYKLPISCNDAEVFLQQCFKVKPRERLSATKLLTSSFIKHNYQSQTSGNI